MRPLNIANQAIPIKKKYRSDKCRKVLFHKNIHNGHVMVALNENNKIITAWSDTEGILTMRCKLVSGTSFKPLLNTLKPNLLILNDGVLLQPIAEDQEIQVYDSTLNEILDALGAFSEDTAHECKAGEGILSYEQFLSLQPDMTKQEYSEWVAAAKKTN